MKLQRFAFEQTPNSHLILIGSPNTQGEIPGVQAFGYNQLRTVTRRGTKTFGTAGPAGITKNYEGVSGSFDVEGVDGENAVLAYASRTALGSFITFDPVAGLMPAYLVANIFDNDGTTPLRSHLVSGVELGQLPRGLPDNARQFSFEALKGREFAGKQLVVQTFDGAASPVTTLTLSSTAIQDPVDSVYALLVLRQASSSTKVVSVLKKTTDYTETATALTLLSGLATGEKALVVFMK